MRASVLKRKDIYCKNRGGKVEIECTLKYEKVGEVVECEYVESWSRKVLLVAKRRLGKRGGGEGQGGAQQGHGV